MKTAELVELHGAQAVKLPEEFRFDGNSVWITRQGDAVLLQPIRPATWPESFFEDIRIDDPAFCRPDQGQTPRAPSLS